MVRRQHHVDVPAAVPHEQLLQKPAEAAVEPYHLIMHLARVGAVGVADIVGGGETHRQQVGRAAAAELQRPHPLQRKGEGERVIPGVARKARAARLLSVGRRCGNVKSWPLFSYDTLSGSWYARSGSSSVQALPAALKGTRWALN